MIAWLTTYDNWLLLRNFAPVLVWDVFGDCLTAYERLLDFAAKLCTSCGVILLRWLPDYQRLLAFASNFAPVLVWNFYGDCLTDNQGLLAFAAKLSTSSGVKRLRWLPEWLPTTTGFCCKTLHPFWCRTFTVTPWLTNYDYWLLLRNFAPVLVWNFYGDCLTDYLRLLAFAAKLCTSSGVKLLRWLPDWQPRTTGFCCETFHQFWCETFTVIAWMTTNNYWLWLQNFAHVLVWNFYGDCFTDHLRQLAFAAKLCTSSGVNLLRWLLDWPLTTTGFCCKTPHQFWCVTFTVIALLTTNDYWLLRQNFAPVLVWNVYGDWPND